MVDWISAVVVTIVILVGLAILYKALKEPIDLLLNGIRNGWFYLTDKAANPSGAVETIRYD